jgi:hypothetical protein
MLESRQPTEVQRSVMSGILAENGAVDTFSLSQLPLLMQPDCITQRLIRTLVTHSAPDCRCRSRQL